MIPALSDGRNDEGRVAAAPEESNNGTDNQNTSAISASPQSFVVHCVKSNGASVPFKQYATRDEAELIAARLCAVGCLSIVEVAR
jgi:hypothetical protein